MRPNVVIYDLEVAKAIPPTSRRPLEPDIEYCRGWDDHPNMGISVLCAYDFANERPYVFCKDNLPAFAYPIDQAEHLVGFNNCRFDNLVIQASSGLVIPPEKCTDLLR
jgi:hypothetical protein